MVRKVFSALAGGVDWLVRDKTPAEAKRGIVAVLLVFVLWASVVLALPITPDMLLPAWLR
jgi:hypothetical protein